MKKIEEAVARNERESRKCLGEHEDHTPRYSSLASILPAILTRFRLGYYLIIIFK
jgi:hypothetical protein